MSKTPPHTTPEVHLKTRKSQPIQQKIRENFYCFDSSPRFYVKQKFYLPQDQKRLAKPRDGRSVSPSNFDSLFARTSPDGFSPDWKFRKKTSPVKNRNLETPKFNRGKKKMDFKLSNTTDDKKKYEEFAKYQEKTGKKVLRLDNLSSVDRIKGISGKLVAYKNLSRVFEGVHVENKDPFESEYSKNYRHHGLEAYHPDSPFGGIPQNE